MLLLLLTDPIKLRLQAFQCSTPRFPVLAQYLLSESRYPSVGPEVSLGVAHGMTHC